MPYLEGAPRIYVSDHFVKQNDDINRTEESFRAVLVTPEIHIALAKRVLHSLEGVEVEAFGRVPTPEDDHTSYHDNGLFLVKGPHERHATLCDGTTEAITRLCVAISMTRGEIIEQTPLPSLNTGIPFLILGSNSKNLFVHGEKCPQFPFRPINRERPGRY